MSKILFISHEANTTGATIYLLRLTRMLSKNGVSISVLFLQEGTLFNDFNDFSKTYSWKGKDENRYTKFFKKVFIKLFSVTVKQKKILNTLKKQNFDLVYCNTIKTSYFFNIIKKHIDAPVVWHIHELSLAIKRSNINISEKSNFVNYIIANSIHTKEYLISKHKLSENKITIHYPFINSEKIFELSKKDLKKDFPKINKDAFVIGSSGSAVYSKGIDVFIKLPLIIDLFFPENKFVYIWTGQCSIFKNIIEYDLKKCGLKEKVFFVGANKNPYPIYNLFDIFISCSREESFGMAAIELATLGKPLISFDNAGGISEIVKKSGNITVPYLDIIAFAKKIIALSKDNNLIKKNGNSAKEFASQFEEEVKANEMLIYLEKIIVQENQSVKS